MKLSTPRLLALGLLALGVSLAACGRSSKFVYYSDQTEVQVTREYSVKEIVRNNALDILWVIDNSGSMGQHQRNVIANSDQFIQMLTTGKKVDWKLGLVSSYVPDAPFIPFGVPGELNHATPDPVKVFNSAVGRLGTGHGCYEVAFEPILNYLAKYPKFTSTRGTLALIIVTDTDEENTIAPMDFLDRVAKIKGDRNVVVYGVFGYEEFHCQGERRTDFGGPIPGWTDGRYKPLIEATGGQAFSLCDPKFGQNLATIGDQLSKFATQSRLYLKDRPIVSTLKVSFKGVELKGGRQEDGAVWYYDPSKSAIMFYTLEFVPDDMAKVQVSYSVDQGL